MVLTPVSVTSRTDDLNVEIKSNGGWSSKKQRSCMEMFNANKKA